MTTMFFDLPRRNSLGVGLAPTRRAAGSEAWKQQIGTKQVPARLRLLPDSKPNWNRIGFSAALQVAALAFFIIVPLLYPEAMQTAVHYYSFTPLTQPQTEIPVAPAPPPPPKVKAPKVEVKPADPIEPVKLNPQQPHIFANFATPKTVQPKVEKVEAKAPELNPVLEAAKIETKENGPKRPREEVKTGTLGSTGSAAPATVKAPVEKVQTGGFGDPNGIPGKGDPRHATNVNRLGSPALPGGDGYGNGTGGAKGIRGTVASSGFGNGVATPPEGGGGGGKKSAVVSGGFSNATETATETPKKKNTASGPADNPPNILDKPRPEYTAEGRSLRIEGDVVIDMVFLANGTVQINKVISGLGHGLDQSAMRAAQQIKFKPAKRDGEPVDFPARVRIEFRLAY